MAHSLECGLSFRQLGVIAGVAGLLGGAALIAAEGLSTVGPLVLVPYTLLALGTALVLQRRGEQRTVVRFTAILAAFMLATVLLYVYIGAFESTAVRAISLRGHTWRIGLMLGIGTAASAIAALLGLGSGSVPRVSARTGAPTA